MRRKYPLYPVMQYDTLLELVQSFPESGDKTAIVFYDAAGKDESYSYKTLYNDISALANGLFVKGFAGKHIAITSENRYEWVVSFIAIMAVGSVAVAVDAEQSSDTLVAMAKRSDCDAVICAKPFIQIYLSGAEPLTVISMDEVSNSDVIPYSSLMSSGQDQLAQGSDVLGSLTSDKLAPAAIFYTSGTTSTSKPVVLTNQNIMYNACNAQQLIAPGEKLFTALPFYHTYSSIAAVLDMLSQAKTVGVNGNLKYTFRDIRLFAPNTIVAVPLMVETMFRYLQAEEAKLGISDAANEAVARYKKRRRWHLKAKTFDHPCIKQLLGDSIEVIISGGAHLNEEIAMRLSAYGLMIIEGYGITECSPLISINRNKSNKIGSVGQLLPGLEVKIQDGEILVKGPSVSPGYYKDDILTAESFKDGWFHTGDIGHLDNEGFLYISGRKKSIIVFNNGKKISPEEIEIMVEGIPFVKEVIAYGSCSGQAADDVKLTIMVYPDPEATKGMKQYEILATIQKGVDEINAKEPLFRRIQIVRLTEKPFERTAMKKIKREDYSNER